MSRATEPPPLAFREEEVNALILGLRLVAVREDEELTEAAEAALARIVAALPPAGEDHAEPDGQLAGDTPRLAAIRRAIRAEERLALAYTDKKGTATVRVVWPVAIGFFEVAEVLAAWCEAREDFRHFRLDRIASATPTGTRYPTRRRVLLADWHAREW